ncbi:MAG: nitrate reductase [Devosiaceae bacterium]|nr:nitrate reductase [Devosiaceae bacterium MH13]
MDALANKTTRTTCPYCGVGCGVKATVDPLAGSVEIAGDEAHPANAGRLCSKGAQLAETLGLDNRLLYPTLGGERTSWDAATGRIAEAFSAAIAEHGPDSVAMYVSGQLMTEDYYVANKLMKGYVGSANIDTNSRLCMASSVAGHKRAFGTDTVPGTYEDLERADLVVLTGSNLAWCHPVLFQRLVAAKQQRPHMKVVVIDPRRTPTAEIADLHLPLQPDSDVALFSGLLRFLSRLGGADRAYTAEHTQGVIDALDAAEPWTLEQTAKRCGLPLTDLAQFYDWALATDRTVTVYSQGVNQSSSGSDKVNAIINTHLLTGRIGQPGMGPFSVTGQPNAMGGREVGGLANMLAGHLELANPEHRALVQTFWDSPTIADTPGLKAVDLFEAIHAGTIKALWVMATNPSVSLPDAARVNEALATVPFLAVSDIVSTTDTLRHAARPGCVALPATGWVEKDGTVTNSERMISRQRGFLPAPGEARHDWQAICDVATKMGFGDAFAFDSPASVFAEHAALSGYKPEVRRDFDISGRAGLSQVAYESMPPFRWPLRADSTQTERFFAGGGFFHADRKARFVPTHAADAPQRPAGTFTLNTGRVRDQWHTMTRTGRSATLSAHMGEPYCEIHPADAVDLGVTAASLVTVSNGRGRIIVRALISAGQQRGSVFVPMHWNDQTAANARVDTLAAPETDPTSGQPALKFSTVKVQPAAMAWHGFAVVRDAPGALPFAYWSVAPCAGGYAIEMADTEPCDDYAELVRQIIGADGVMGVQDRASGDARFLVSADESVQAALFFARDPVAVSRRWAIEKLSQPLADAAAKVALLAGRPPADQPDQGPIVCACFAVGRNTIAAAITDGATSLDAVGAACQAGTNCGSCRSEIAAMLPQDTEHETEKPQEVRHAPQAV